MLELDVASNGCIQSECVLQKHFFLEKKRCKDEMNMSRYCHEKLPKMQNIFWGHI
jgi:hypothetical protein